MTSTQQPLWGDDALRAQGKRMVTFPGLSNDYRSLYYCRRRVTFSLVSRVRARVTLLGKGLPCAKLTNPPVIVSDSGKSYPAVYPAHSTDDTSRRSRQALTTSWAWAKPGEPARAGSLSCPVMNSAAGKCRPDSEALTAPLGLVEVEGSRERQEFTKPRAGGSPASWRASLVDGADSASGRQLPAGGGGASAINSYTTAPRLRRPLFARASWSRLARSEARS